MAKKGANTSDSTAISLIRMLSEGPEVSLSGSPMVSPITAALCGSDPFGPRVLACSEAPAYKIIIIKITSLLRSKQRASFFVIMIRNYLNVLLSIVPRTTSVRSRYCYLTTETKNQINFEFPGMSIPKLYVITNSI